jgi:adenylate cyclase
MTRTSVQRRLAAILAADIVGYSRLMEQDESGTLSALIARRTEVLEPAVARHRGRIFKTTGDGMLAEFGSAVDAVQCAVDLQRKLAEANEGAAEAARIVLRIGISLGDVIAEGEDLYGDAVNVAARLETIAEPGGILISGAARDFVHNKVPAAFEDLGPQRLKNMSAPVHAYRITGLARAPAPAVRMVESKPAIAVLPLANLSGDPGQDYFSDGLTTDLITELARFHEFAVIGAASSFAYKGRSGSRQIGAELGARYVVEGSVRKLADRLRISVQLLDTEAGGQLMAEHYDCRLDELFAVQDEVTRAIVAKVVGRAIETAHQSALRATPEQSLAYDCWLRGQHQLLRWTPEADDEALTWFERALGKDPHFARAHSAIALLLNGKVLLRPGYPDEASDRSRALRHARLSVEYDPADARSHMALAYVSLFLRELGRAKRHFQLARDLNPNAADTIMNCALGLAYLGDVAQGKELAARAMALNPLHLDWYYYELAQLHFLCGEYEACIDTGRPYVEEFPELPGWTAAALGLLNRSEAAAEAARFLEGVERFWRGKGRMRPEDAISWFFSINTFQTDRVMVLLKRGLQAAGLPVPG